MTPPAVIARPVASLIVYYWAMAVALSTEQIEEMIGEVELPEEGMEPVAH